MAAKTISFSKLRFYWPIYILVLPSAALVGLFSYFPAVNGFYHAFFRWTPPDTNEWVGMRNIEQALRDPVLWDGFKVVLVLVAANLFRMIPSILTAVAVNRLRNQKWAYVYKVMFVLPMIIPEMVGLLVWKFIFNPNNGPLNALLQASGGMWLLNKLDDALGWNVFYQGQPPVWLGDAELVIPSLILWGFPWVGAVSVLIYLAGLQSIEESIYESAELDGISSIGKFVHIELPLILTQVRITLVLMIIGTLQGFHLMLVLLGPSGGPRGVGMVPGLYMFNQAFVQSQYGYACAIGVILFVFVLVLTEINNRFVKVKR